MRSILAPCKLLTAGAQDPYKLLTTDAQDPCHLFTADAQDLCKSLTSDAQDPSKLLTADAQDPCKLLNADAQGQDSPLIPCKVYPSRQNMLGQYRQYLASKEEAAQKVNALLEHCFP